MNRDRANKNKEKISLSSSLLLIAVGGIGFNLVYKYDRYYLGEPLIARQIYIQDKPEYIYDGEGTSRYTFKGKNYPCRFWLSEGALKTIKDNELIKNSVEFIEIGDTIEVKIRQPDELKLQDAAARPRVIELARKSTVIISASQVQAEDQKWLYINFGIPIVCLLIWLFIQVRRIIASRSSTEAT
ncbi:hypothetical protein [Paraflavitalea sp. CAU 1676]|uniref:hypothetical protein n=1 Tax=Paraflavitalea sp. CAU 1676 TaxID=3032598 RepID=UPI0023DAB8CC|nr:hypothetical protein [Paraflavitalea sp. CAU 1676]MDF2193456.1 hypothetical protein [Paraflavitalea sp. CAU 1676]